MQQYSMEGEWPTKLEQTGMSEDDTSDGQYIDKIRPGTKGEIAALLSKDFAKIRYGRYEYSLAVFYKFSCK